MPIERRFSRDAFLPEEMVVLKQLCLTPGKMFQPGQYKVDELPDIAFSMGLVAKLDPKLDQHTNPSDGIAL